MATLDEWAYNIKNLARAGQGGSDDDTLGIRQIKFWIQGYRAEGIEQLTDYGKDIDPQLVTDFGVLKLEEVDKSDSECPVGVDWGCTIKKVKIPKLVGLPRDRALLFIGKIDKQSGFVRDHANVHEFVKETRFGRMFNRYYLVGNTVYIELRKKDANLCYINGRGVVEDPSKVDVHVLNEEGECVTTCWDDAINEYPLTMKLYRFITTSILQTELGMTLQTVNSLLNNAQNEIQVAG